MDDEYSKRKVIFEDEEKESNLDYDSPDQVAVDFEDEEEYGIEDLISDLESGDSDIGFDDIDLSDFDEEDDYTLEDLMKELESEEEEEDVGDTDSDNLEVNNKYDAKDFVSFLESENDGLEPISVEDDLESEDNSSLMDEENEETSLKIQNESIKLDLWLEKCVDQKFIDSFLKYKSITIDIGSSPLSEIMSTFELEDLLKFKYKSNLKEFKNSLKELFLPLGVMQIVDIATKHHVSVSLTKDGLITNFLKKFSMYELVVIFNEEGLKINDYLNISVLEQIYLSTDSKLEKISKSLLSKDANSKYEMISSIVNQYSDKYLISKDIFKGDDL